jgi:cyclopropane fatty-acyl-phospholipid synthase-like methyltransferase
VDNSQSLTFYKQLATESIDSGVVKFSNDHTEIDAELIRQRSRPDHDLLDLGSGTGLVVNKLISDFRSITAVELFTEFSDFIDSENILVINQNLMEFSLAKCFDMVTVFGTAHYFTDFEITEIYGRAHAHLKNLGKLIIKNQFALKETKTVTESTLLGGNYFAQYRPVELEISILKDLGFRNFDVIDIYPAAANKWEDTHYYAVCCEKCD